MNEETTELVEAVKTMEQLAATKAKDSFEEVKEKMKKEEDKVVF